MSNIHVESGLVEFVDGRVMPGPGWAEFTATFSRSKEDIKHLAHVATNAFMDTAWRCDKNSVGLGRAIDRLALAAEPPLTTKVFTDEAAKAMYQWEGEY